MASPYDAIAGMYDRHWDDWYLPAALPALELLFFSHLQHGASVLDVCCGSGHVTEELVARGYLVAGIDQSAALIEIARKRLPTATLRVDDARTFGEFTAMDAALSTFDALNHLLCLEDLHAAYCRIFAALKPGGLFLFDMNLAAAYTLDLHNWSTQVEENAVSLLRGTFDWNTQLAATELIWFLRRSDGFWDKREATVYERCYDADAITAGLARAGFENIQQHNASECGVSAGLAFGRVFFQCWRPR